MIILMPFYREMQNLVVFFLEEIAAQMKGQAAFHDAGGAVEAPLDKGNAYIASGKKESIMKNVFSILLKFANEPAVKDGKEGYAGIGGEKHQIDENIFFPFLAGIVPGCLEKRYIRVRH
jgi:hypothetical protein